MAQEREWERRPEDSMAFESGQERLTNQTKGITVEFIW
jgi:hypothetical protein